MLWVDCCSGTDVIHSLALCQDPWSKCALFDVCLLLGTKCRFAGLLYRAQIPGAAARGRIQQRNSWPLCWGCWSDQGFAKHIVRVVSSSLRNRAPHWSEEPIFNLHLAHAKVTFFKNCKQKNWKQPTQLTQHKNATIIIWQSVLSYPLPWHLSSQILSIDVLLYMEDTSID